jgi:hypothetical protein
LPIFFNFSGLLSARVEFSGRNIELRWSLRLFWCDISPKMTLGHANSSTEINISFRRLEQIESWALSFSWLQSIDIPQSLEILYLLCFESCLNLSSISFELSSRLNWIESSAFWSFSLQSIEIPRSVQFIDGSAFAETKLDSVLIEAGSDIFHMEHKFLIDIVYYKLIRNFSVLSDVEFPRTMEILGSSCFSSCRRLSSISFESNSEMKRIEAQSHSLWRLWFLWCCTPVRNLILWQ